MTISNLKQDHCYKGCILESNGDYWDSIRFKVDEIYIQDGVTMVSLLVKLLDSIAKGAKRYSIISIITSPEDIDVIQEIDPEEFKEGLIK